MISFSDDQKRKRKNYYEASRKMINDKSMFISTIGFDKMDEEICALDGLTNRSFIVGSCTNV